MGVSNWLLGLGLTEYDSAFRENRIDFDVLPKLTAEDLKEIGVAAVGDRHRILAAIETLAKSPPVRAGEGQAASAVLELAERRQLTVIVADLVGSTALSARLDPEEMRKAIGACRQACADVIEREKGFVAKYMGDAVLAYFGYPRAHEDDAECAVRAGLAVAQAISRIRAPDGSLLQVRVGIATGVVVVGDLLGSGEAHERGVVGDTPNLAARLQAIAKPGGVVIAESTKRLVGDLFELEDLGVPELKGLTSSAHIYSALRIRSVANRFEALHPEGLAPLVGRDEELEIVMRRWARARTGDGQVILVTGEPGIGKSRLIAAIATRLQSEPHIRLGYSCSPQRTDSAFHPIAGELERAAEIAGDDNLKSALDKLDAELSRRGGSIEDSALFRDLLMLGDDGRYPDAVSPPRERRRRTLEAILEQIEALSRKGTALVVFEDAQWSDPSSLEVIDRLVDRIEKVKVLLIVTYRPEFAAPWTGRSSVTTLTLNRMTRTETEALVNTFLEGKELPDRIKHDIVERSGGVPLFAEEMAKSALEAVEDGLSPTCSLSLNGTPSRTLPSALQASLLARLDRLGDAREIIQVGAAIGREFSQALISRVARKDEAELTAALDRLVRSGLLVRHGAGSEATYAFKHSLCQDAAYGALLRETRQDLHLRIAAALEAQGLDPSSSQPDAIARHYAEAGDPEKAAANWARAGRLALERSQFAEAEAQLTRALALTKGMPTSPSIRRLRRSVKADLARLKALSQPDDVRRQLHPVRASVPQSRDTPRSC